MKYIHFKNLDGGEMILPADVIRAITIDHRGTIVIDIKETSKKSPIILNFDDPKSFIDRLIQVLTDNGSCHIVDIHHFQPKISSS